MNCKTDNFYAQPLTPPDTNDALRRSVEDRVKMRFCRRAYACWRLWSLTSEEGVSGKAESWQLSADSFPGEEPKWFLAGSWELTAESFFGRVSSCETRCERGLSLRATGLAIKRWGKGIWWMPWRQEAMKDVANCDKPRGVVSTLWSGDFRMG